MFAAVKSNSPSFSEKASVSSGPRTQDLGGLNIVVSTISSPQPQKNKRKRSLPGNPDPEAEVIALSPKTLLATNRFVCEICNKGFQRDQNLQLHRRGHNLQWKLKQRNVNELKKKAYVCPEPSCVHHNPARALGDLTGIKKHYCRKHGEKKWRCEKCSKVYAVQSDWKAHTKTCGTREYRCDCGTLFSRKDSFVTHRAFCDALAEESARISASQLAASTNPLLQSLFSDLPSQQISLNPWDPQQQNPNPSSPQNLTVSTQIKLEAHPQLHIPSLSPPSPLPPSYYQDPQPQKSLIASPYQSLHLTTNTTSNATASAHMSATALLQKAATVGASAMRVTGKFSPPFANAVVKHAQQSVTQKHMGELRQLESLCHVSVEDYMGRGGMFPSNDLPAWQKSDHLTRDFLGLTGNANRGDYVGGDTTGRIKVSIDDKDVLTFTDSEDYQREYDRPLQGHGQHSLLKPPQHQGYGFADTAYASETWGTDIMRQTHDNLMRGRKVI